jgi:hypothetical protein
VFGLDAQLEPAPVEMNLTSLKCDGHMPAMIQKITSFALAGVLATLSGTAFAQEAAPEPAGEPAPAAGTAPAASAGWSSRTFSWAGTSRRRTIWQSAPSSGCRLDSIAASRRAGPQARRTETSRASRCTSGWSSGFAAPSTSSCDRFDLIDGEVAVGESVRRGRLVLSGGTVPPSRL